jgi:hypothetical protein
LSDRLATVFAVELFIVLEQLLKHCSDEKERLGYLREGLREIRLMRRGDHNAARLLMEQERWERQCDRESEAECERIKEESKARMIRQIFSTMTEQTLAGAFGGGESARKLAAMLTKIGFDLPLDNPPNPTPTQTQAAMPTDSAQTKSN